MARMIVCGAVNWDVTAFVENLPSAGEEVSVSKVISVPGGKGANTAVAAARILGPAEAGIIGTLGSDDIADRQIRNLEDEGVDTSCITKLKGVGSGQAYVIVDSRGENMILAYKAANRMMTPEIVASRQVLSAIEQASMMVIIDPPFDVAAVLAAEGRKIGKAIALSPALLTRHGFSALREYLSSADLIILNEHEARLLASEGNGIHACMKLSERLDGKKVVTTLGGKGCIFCWKGRKALVPTMDLASFGLRMVSTVGAGDTFVGAVGAFKLKGHDDLESLFLANIAAALKTTREETRGSPTYDQIKRYMDDGHMRSLYAGIRMT